MGKPLFDFSRLMELDGGIGSLLEDYAFLYGFICLYRSKRIAEVGTNTGISSIVMAQALEDCGEEGHIFTVDLDPEALSTARRQISGFGLENRITAIQGDVTALPAGNYDLAFIDGGHIYQDVKRDLEVLYPRSSLVLLHDAVISPDVKRATEEYAGQKTLLSYPVGRHYSFGKMTPTRTAPGWYILVPQK